MKPIFVTTVTVVPADWANSVSNLVYDVFHQASTVQQAKDVLGIGSLGGQSLTSVNLLGGKINGVVIGDVNPMAATFSNVTLAEFTPVSASHATSKHYVDTSIVSAIGALQWKDMAQQRSSSVNITGGSGMFDVLRSRSDPSGLYDVVTLGWLQANGAGMAQASAPLPIEPDGVTVNTSFPTVTGRCAIFVDGLYQLPDTYVVTGSNQIRFADALPSGSVVGGFRV